VEVKALLASVEQRMTPEDLERLHEALRGVAGLPLGGEDPLRDYLLALSDFSDHMAEIDTGIRKVRASLDSGDYPQARAELDHLEELRDETKPAPLSLRRLLDWVADEYEIDTTTQLEKIDELDVLLQTYTKLINQMNAELTAQQSLVQTTLSLGTSSADVFIEETLVVYGYLKAENGTALAGKNITISWGWNLTVPATTNWQGMFEAGISFQAGFPAGSAQVEASFQPEGSDSQVYLSSKSQIAVSVKYQPTVITADISPTNTAVLGYVDVRGNLSSTDGVPLASYTVTALLDGSFLENAPTNDTGWFTFSFEVPQTLSSGTHVVTLTFAPTGRFAGSHLTLPFSVNYLETQLNIDVDRITLLSGWKLLVNGTVAYPNGTEPKYGNVTIFIDSTPYQNSTVKDGGSFVSVIELPIGLGFGSHSIAAEYNPVEPWVQKSQAATQVYVYNTPTVIIAAVGIPSATSIGVYLVRKRRKATAPLPTVPEPEAAEPSLKEEFSREKLISMAEQEGDDASIVKRSFRLAQTLIDREIGESPRQSETHWEYFSRVAQASPQIKESLRRLAELYELAEYSPYPVESAQSEEAKQILLKIREEL